MGDMTEISFLQLFYLSLSSSLFSFFSLNPSISKTVGGIGLKFCTQVAGFNDQTHRILLSHTIYMHMQHMYTHNRPGNTVTI